ncbi:MAG: sulfatase-like hydrolase/transferase [Alphaproteobacteria bacterium]
MPAKNGLFLLIDALRYDVLSDEQARRFLTPNLAKLVESGFVRPVTANAQSTQFVMPSIFSQTYPLDYGGYNNGIRERPKSFVEALKAGGYETHLLASCNQLGVATGYTRGFDTVRTTSDFRVLLEQRISRTLLYHLKNSVPEDGNCEVVKEMALLLDGIEELIVHHDRSLWPKKLQRINNRVAQGCRAEKALLNRDPRAVLLKLTTIAPGIYWRFLGQSRPVGFRRFWHRAIESVRWRTRRWVAAQTLWPFLALSHFPVTFADIISPLCQLVRERAGKQWFVHMHMMDVHDCRAVNRPMQLVRCIGYLPRWWVARIKGYSNRRWLYDTTVMSVDHLLGRLFETLKETGQLHSTVILVTGDHGLYYAESPRKKMSVGYRTHYEDLDVPLLLANSDQCPADRGMIDSMGVTATFLDALGVAPDESFKGISALLGGRRCVVSENCGHGNADIARRDIYFTVTTKTHKLLAVLRGTSIEAEELYDRDKDPRELLNIVSDPSHKATIDGMLKLLREERAELFALRAIR